jgi:hypothetical protein
MWKWLGAVMLVIILSVPFALRLRAAKNLPDCGFVQNTYGERVSWKNEGLITLYIHDSVPREYYGAIQSAAATWEKSIGHRLFNLVMDPLVGTSIPHQDGKNIIYFMNTWEANRPTEQARTSIYWNGDQIVEADIRINSKDFQFYWAPGQFNPLKVNFEALILHEMGHVLGLRHKDNAGSVMATFLPSGTDRVRLASADASNLQCEYKL